MGLKVTNNAFGTLNAGITSSSTTIVLNSGEGARFPTLGAGDYFYATLIDTSNNLEIVKVTARSTDTMTVVRAQDNTTARAFSTNDRFELRPTAALFNEKANADDVTASLATKQDASPVLTSYIDRGTQFRNRIINGDMRIDQRNNGASITLGTVATYITDRWVTSEDSDGAMTAQQSSSVVPSGFVNSLGFTTTTADASLGATQRVLMGQNIEGFNVADLGWGTASAQTITVSFFVRSSLTGTFGAVVKNSGSPAYRSYPFTYVINAANTWEYKTVTIPGDTSGTWLTNNGIGIELGFGLGVGSTYSGPAGSWATADYNSATGAVSVIGTLNATWYITGVQLEAGSVATPFERRPYGTELALCQRYYQKSRQSYVPGNGFTVGLGSAFFRYGAGNDSYSQIAIPFPTVMRVAPTMTTYDSSGASGKFSYYVSSWLNGGTSNIAYALDAAFSWQANNLAAYNYNFEWTASAEL